ncbi:hypothetical protein DEU37_2330 [Microbacterium sp. AG790]|uniref:hypothetical protein n=1 Tax=Microbacterium sp. AG790 TaxID=2183995 RepID=UPI000EB08469|nr:hypothetical protein [Microbacterium sp. AG790]RKS86676.1 hypothetical protein DEU37_2330 [Microbacterium sp. AG790]
MTAFRHGAERPRPRRGGLVVLATGLVVALSVPPVVATSAAFTSGVDAATTQSGGVRLAQGPSEDDRYPDAAHPHEITVDTDGAQKVAYLASAPVGPPSVATASFTVNVHLLTPTPHVVMHARLVDPNPDAPWLLFDVRVADASLLPSGAPLTATEISALDGGAGLPLPTPAADGLALTVCVWLAPAAPPSAFAATVVPAIAVTAETTGGRTVTLTEKLS